MAADGVINNTNNESSVLQAGFDTRIGITGGPLDYQYAILSPYAQTDFEFEAEAYGFQGSWEPYLLQVHLGGFYPAQAALQYFWRLNIAADFLHVVDPGQTKLKADTNYAWLGGTVSAMFFPFEEYFAETDYSLYASASYSHFWDILSGEQAPQFIAEIGLNLNPKATTAIAATYTKGKNRSDLQEKDEATISLKVKY